MHNTEFGFECFFPQLLAFLWLNKSLLQALLEFKIITFIRLKIIETPQTPSFNFIVVLLMSNAPADRCVKEQTSCEAFENSLHPRLKPLF